MTTWVNLEGVMLNEVSQTQKDKYSMVPLIWGSKTVRLLEAESRMVVTRGQGERE